MKTFAVTLAILACIGTMLFTELVNGETITIISTDGTYVPGNAKLLIGRFLTDEILLFECLLRNSPSFQDPR